MQYGQPNGELTTGNICKFEENLQNVLHSQSIGEPVIKKKSRIFLSKNCTCIKTSFLSSWKHFCNWTEGITNWMIKVRRNACPVCCLFGKLPHNSFEKFITGLSILSSILKTQESTSYSLILTTSYSEEEKQM